MPDDKLQPDPEAVEIWKNLPQNEPSRQAMPPLTGGLRWTWALAALLAAVVVIGLLVQASGS